MQPVHELSGQCFNFSDSFSSQTPEKIPNKGCFYFEKLSMRDLQENLMTLACAVVFKSWGEGQRSADPSAGLTHDT